RGGRQPGGAGVLRDLGLSALPAIRCRARPRRPRTPPDDIRQAAGAADPAGLLDGAHAPGDLPRHRWGVLARLVALLRLPPAVLAADGRGRHPGGVDPVRGGDLLSRAAALGCWRATARGLATAPDGTELARRRSGDAGARGSWGCGGAARRRRSLGRLSGRDLAGGPVSVDRTGDGARG